ncbi:MAG: AAA family ATPase [Cyanobacteria bacterium P01_F01_bin.150]
MTPPIVKRYLMAVKRHYWAGIVGFVGVTAASGFVAVQPPAPTLYKSEGILVYVAPPMTFSATAASIREQAQGVTGTGLISDEVVEFVSHTLEEQGIKVAPKALRKGVRAKVMMESVLQVDVSYQAEDKENANAINTMFMDALVDQSRVFNTIQLTRMRDNLNELLPKIESELKDAQAELEAYVRTEAPSLAAAQDGTVISAIAAAQNSQRAIEIALVGLKSQISSLQTRLGMTPDEAYASSALSSDPIIANLRAQLYQAESQDAILGQRFQPEHPQMVELANQKAAYESLLQQRVTEVIGGQDGTTPLQSATQIRQDSSLDPARQQLANQLVALQAELEQQQNLLITQQQLEQDLRKEYSLLPNKQIKQAELAQAVALKQAFYSDIQARLADVTLAEKETVGSFVVAQPAQVSTPEVEPGNPIVTIIAGCVIGVIVGGALIFFLDSADPTFRLASDIQKMLQEQEVPILGLLPDIPPDPAQPQLMPVITAVDSPYLELFERFRSNLQRSTGTTPPKMVLITSTLAGEGKSFTAYNLAIASARAGKRTLLIETDLRTPSSAYVLNASPEPESSLDPVKYYDPASNSIRLVTAVENLYILPHPGEQVQAAAILESSEMRRTFEDAKGRFDFVILDSPSLSRSNDALLLEPYTDGMVLVTRPHYTEEGLLTEAIEQFIESETSTVQILGMAVNGHELNIFQSHSESAVPPPLTLNDLANNMLDDNHSVGLDVVDELNLDGEMELEDMHLDLEDTLGPDASDLAPSFMTEAIVHHD